MTTTTVTVVDTAIEAAARHASEVARERLLADSDARRQAARRESQARFNEQGLPRGLYLEV